MGCCGSQTYMAAFTALNAGTDPTTLLFELVGSATKKVRLLRIVISGTIATTAEDWDLQLTKQSTASTGGTSTSATVVPTDSDNNAGTAVFKGFTVAPTAGTLVGVMAVAKLPLAIAPAIVQTPLIFEFSNVPGRSRPTLHTAAETLGIRANAVDPGNTTSIDCYAFWEEMPLNA
jgi:hypothetical protein